MEFDQKEEAPFNLAKKKVTDKKTLVIYIATGVISISSLIYGYVSYQATYFKDAEIQMLKADLEDANIKLQRIDMLENQVKELEASLVAKAAIKPEPKKETKPSPLKDIKKVTSTKKTVKKLNGLSNKIKKTVKN